LKINGKFAGNKNLFKAEPESAGNEMQWKFYAQKFLV